MKSHKLRWTSIPKKLVMVVLLASMPIITSCNFLKLSPPGWMGQKPSSDPPSGEHEGPIPVDPGDGGGGEAVERIFTRGMSCTRSQRPDRMMVLE